MNLEASVHKVREFAKTFEALVDIGDALEEALAADNAALAAEKRLKEADKALDRVIKASADSLVAANKIRLEADAVLADAKSDAAAIRAEAKSKADVLAAKSKDKSDAQAEAHATAAEKFTIQKQTNDEILAMANAQIAHAEAKLSEIRAAIAKITGG